MYSLIMKVAHNQEIKDTLSIFRGLYKIAEGAIEVNHATKPSRNEKASYSEDNQKTMTGVSKLNTINNSKESKSAMKPVNQSQLYKNSLGTIAHKGVDNVSINDMQINKVPAGRFERFVSFGKLGKKVLEFGVGAYFAKNVSGTDASGMNLFYEKAAEDISKQLCKMRGAPLKLAQMLSIQEEDLIPAPIRKAFEKARHQAHVMPTEEIFQQMQTNLGENWYSKYHSFEEKPFASASIGQVHKAIGLNKQDKLAVKVQYPGVKKSISSDINNLKLLMKIPGLLPKGIYMENILKKTEQQLAIQCDYLNEARQQILYQKCLKKAFGEQSWKYKIPLIYHDLTTQSVETSQFLEGLSMKTLEEDVDIPQEVKDQIGYRIIKLTFMELFSMGIMQSDPNPSNFSYNASTDQLNLYDFGATHIYNTDFLKKYYQIIQGSIQMDHDKIIKNSISTGFLTGEENKVMIEHHLNSILTIGEPLRFEGKYNFGAQQMTKKVYASIPIMLKNRLKAPPEEVYSLHRKLSGSYLACMRLGARVNCNEILSSIKFESAVNSF